MRYNKHLFSDPTTLILQVVNFNIYDDFCCTEFSNTIQYKV